MVNEVVNPAITIAEEDDLPAPPPPSLQRRVALVAAAVGLLVTILLLGGLAVPRGQGADPAPDGLVYVIPAGRAASMGEPGVDSAVAIPTDIRFASLDAASITIRNDDTVTHRAGPFVVGAGQTFVQRFWETGTFPFVCAVNPAESIVVTVAQASP